MKKVLVTGGTGFIGQQTLMPLLNRGYEVHVVSSKAREAIDHRIIFHLSNLLDCNEHHRLMQAIRPTHLLHTAWYTENGKYWDAIDNVYWLKATISLGEAFYHQGGNRLLGIGTCAEYDWQEGICIEGKTAENPSSLYGKMKKAAYESLNALAKKYTKSFAWARIFFPYGIGESEKRLIPHVITHLLRDQAARCTHGLQIRDFLYVEEMGDALAATLESDVIGAINIGSGVPVTIQEVVNKIAFALNKKNLLKLGDLAEPTYSPPKILADINRLKKEVGWSAKLSLDEGIAQTIAWWRDREIIRRGVEK